MRERDQIRANGYSQAIGIQLGLPPRGEQPEPPKTEDQLRYEALPNSAIRYLDTAKSSHQEGIGDDSRAVLRSRAAEVFNGMEETDKKALIDYLTWRQEQVVAPLRRKVSGLMGTGELGPEGQPT